jgi:hypothetical protein
MGNTVRAEPARTSVPPQRTRIAAGNLSTTLTWNQPSRTGISIHNVSGGALLINEGFPATPADYTQYIPAGGIWEGEPPVYTGPISGYWLSPGASDYAQVTERGISELATYAPGSLQSIRSVSVAGSTLYSFNAAQGLDLATYRAFVFFVEGARPTTDGSALLVATSQSVGASDYEYASSVRTSAGVLTDVSSANNISLPISGTGIGSVAADELGITAEITVACGGSALQQPTINWWALYRNVSQVAVRCEGTGYRRSTTQITSVDFYMLDGLAFEQGVIDIYGVRRP